MGKVKGRVFAITAKVFLPRWQFLSFDDQPGYKLKIIGISHSFGFRDQKPTSAVTDDPRYAAFVKDTPQTTVSGQPCLGRCPRSG
jgi:hypothetical protein